MNKLEEKLEELGYKRCSYYKYEKTYDFFCGGIIVEIDIKEEPKGRLRLDVYDWLYTQQDIDALQQVFNEMERDLEILKGVENALLDVFQTSNAAIAFTDKPLTKGTSYLNEAFVSKMLDFDLEYPESVRAAYGETWLDAVLVDVGYP